MEWHYYSRRFFLNLDSNCCKNSTFFLLTSIITGVYNFVPVTKNVPQLVQHHQLPTLTKLTEDRKLLKNRNPRWVVSHLFHSLLKAFFVYLNNCLTRFMPLVSFYTPYFLLFSGCIERGHVSKWVTYLQYTIFKLLLYNRLDSDH